MRSNLYVRSYPKPLALLPGDPATGKQSCQTGPDPDGAHGGVPARTQSETVSHQTPILGTYKTGRRSAARFMGLKGVGRRVSGVVSKLCAATSAAVVAAFLARLTRFFAVIGKVAWVVLGALGLSTFRSNLFLLL